MTRCLPCPPTRVLLTAGLLAATGFCAPWAAAQDLFSVTATGGGSTVTASDENLLDLLEDAIETQGAFNPLVGSDITAVLRYADVENAIVVTLNAAETQATLSFPGTGFSQVFNGSDADDLENEIERFIEEDGGQAFAEFLADLNQRSLLAVLDGNPFSTTALTNEHLFDLYGLGLSGPRLGAGPLGGGGGGSGSEQPLDAGYVVYDYDGARTEVDQDTGTYTTNYEQAWFSVTPRISSLDAAGFDGVSASLGLAAGWWFTDWIGISVGGDVSTNDFDGTTTFHSSFHLALPIQPIDTFDEQGFGFALGVTPFVLSGVGGSVEAAAGGAFNGYGGALNATVGLGHVQFRGAAQIIEFNDQDLDFGDFEFETELNQSAVTVGGNLRVYLDGPNGHWWVDGGLTYVEYLDDAAVSDWLRPEVGVGWRWGGNSRVRVAYRDLIAEADDGRDFDATSITANVVFSY